MKKLFLLSVLWLVVLSGCWNNSEYYDDCDEPMNPYNDGGWHDAWFNRAEETWWYCDWNSDSFNEGCEEYYSQLDEYETCVGNQ